MVVTIEKGLDHVRQYLEAVGKYEIYLENEYVGPTDALIYSKERESESFEAFQEHIRVQNLVEHEHTDHGVMIINAKNKSPKEIERLLDSRLFDSIF